MVIWGVEAVSLNGELRIPMGGGLTVVAFVGRIPFETATSDNVAD